ncbi:hypothetical protein THAOC_32224 [Thalassiosira oceanica]|uniref:Uncharacterized protein n=1 Tax=Thalassiosira oceanica TaxID=159749 RepID=K0RJ24_THAOC|nr:hypothetical protein THAOC_32224 [Thalassiosira oceanica]|eukprot:EJK48941.1 hypothetical protein THAOC_32224 [Thalassiosira oceanica]
MPLGTGRSTTQYKVAAKSPVECRRGGAKGGVAKSLMVHLVRRSASALYCRVGTGFCQARVALYERGKSKGPFQRYCQDCGRNVTSSFSRRSAIRGAASLMVQHLASVGWQGLSGICERQSNCTPKLQSLVRLAHFSLGDAYFNGDGVQEDVTKATAFFTKATKAAMQGHVESRYNLGSIEEQKGNYGRAVRHWQISAKMGSEKSVQNIIRVFMGGCATKEQSEAMNGYQDKVEEMKSHDRDEAKRLGH